MDSALNTLILLSNFANKKGNKMTLLSFHGSKIIKDIYISRIKAHMEADEIVQGTGWDGKKGCAVGCTLDNYNVSRYPIEIGIPKWLGKVQDTIHEGLTVYLSKKWPLNFLESIPVGVDLEQVKNPFLIMVLESTLKNFDNELFHDVLESINNVIELFKNNISSDSEEWNFAAAASAASEAKAGAWAAEAAAAGAWAAAAAAAWAAAAGAWAAEESVNNKYRYFSEKLIELLKECK